MSVSTVIVVIIIAVGFFLGLSRIVASFSGKSCCSDGQKRTRVKKAIVADTDVSHYQYQANFLIGGMSCEGCAQNVANALNAVEGLGPRSTLGAVSPRFDRRLQSIKRLFRMSYPRRAIKSCSHSVAGRACRVALQLGRDPATGGGKGVAAKEPSSIRPR